MAGHWLSSATVRYLMRSRDLLCRESCGENHRVNLYLQTRARCTWIFVLFAILSSEARMTYTIETSTTKVFARSSIIAPKKRNN